MQSFRTKLSREEFDAYEVKYPCNMVIVEMPPAKDILVSGIKVNFNEDTLYAEGESSHVADMAPVSGTVAKTVDRLYFNPRDTAFTMSWETQMELEVGDQVWFHALISKNCSEIQVEDIVYKVIPYEDIFVAKRGSKIVPLNGNVLLDEVFLPKLSKFDISEPQLDKTKGVVVYNGSDNTAYQAPGISDMTGLKPGDIVSISSKAYIYYLERSKYNSTFEDGKMFICIQKRYIDAVL